MKSAMIIYTEYSKDVRVDKEVNTLRRNGIDVNVYSYKISNESNFKNYNRVNLTKKTAILRYFEFYKKLKKILLVQKPEIIHSHDLLALPIGYFLAKKINAKFIFDAHELYHTLNNHQKIKRKILEYFLPKVDYLITVNESIENIYKNEFKALNTLTLKNTPDFERESNEKLLRKTLGINKESKVILFQGYVVPHKGVEYLVDVLKYLDETYKLVYMGMINEEYKKQLISYIDDNDCLDRVYFLDAVPYNKIYNYTSDADFGVYLPDRNEPNNYYSLPNKVFEYLASGLNIIVSDLPELKKLVEKHNVGLVLEQENDVILNADKIEKFIIKEVNGTIFHWTHEENKLLELYRELKR